MRFIVRFCLLFASLAAVVGLSGSASTAIRGQEDPEGRPKAPGNHRQPAPADHLRFHLRLAGRRRLQRRDGSAHPARHRRAAHRELHLLAQGPSRNRCPGPSHSGRPRSTTPAATTGASIGASKSPGCSRPGNWSTARPLPPRSRSPRRTGRISRLHRIDQLEGRRFPGLARLLGPAPHGRRGARGISASASTPTSATTAATTIRR